MLGIRLKGASSLVLAFRSSATSTASTIVVPNDVVKGDLLVLYDRAGNTSGTPTTVIPTDFSTALNNTSSGQLRFICSYKVAVGTEAGTTLTGMNGNNLNGKILLVFSTNGALTASSFDPDFQNTDGNPTAQTITSGSGVVPLVAFAFMRQVTVTSQSFSPAEDGTVVSGTTTGYYKVYNSTPPSDITADCGDGGNNNALMSFYIEVN